VEETKRLGGDLTPTRLKYKKELMREINCCGKSKKLGFY
jgi:hypothetical protein